ncbi:MAG: two-component regulator propeller domain-containing protein, partial [Bacteroidota bacterium]
MKPFHSFILAIALLIGCQDRPQPSLTPQKIRVEPVEIKPLPYYVNGEGDTIDISQPVKIEAKLDTNYRLPLQAVPIQNKKVTRFRDNVTPAKAPLIVPVEASMWDTLVHGDTLKSIIRTRSLKGKTVNLIKSPIKRVSQPITEGNPNYSITSLTTDLGLPSSNIIGFLQDSKGNIWINTEETLLRYDGKYIHSYQLQEMLIGGMQSIIEDEHQHIWVKSFNKLYYFDGFQFTVFDKDSGLFKNAKDITPLFASMNLDQQGNLWYGYWGEFGYISDSTITHFSGLSDLLMSRIFCDSKGNVWLENWEKSQLLKFDGNHILKLKTKIPNVTDESFAYLTEA